MDASLAAFDYRGLEALHRFAEATGGAFDGVFWALGAIFEKGAAGFAVGAILLAFKRTRLTGARVLAAVFLGAALTNGLLKPLVARARPFEGAVAAYKEWWLYAGAPPESGYSFPSGHATAAMAAMAVLAAAAGRRLGWAFLVLATLTGVSRCYFLAHYPSDVLAGFAVGAIGAASAWLLIKPATLQAFGRIPLVRAALGRRRAAGGASETEGTRP